MFSPQPPRPRNTTQEAVIAGHNFAHDGKELVLPRRSGILERLSKEEVGQILQYAKAEATEFIARTGLTLAKEAKEISSAAIPQQQMQKFEEWYEKSGRAEMGEFVEKLACFIQEIDLQGHPGHDRRHILIQDPLIGLGLIGSTVNGEKIEGVRSLFLIPSIFHDLGRLLEPALGRKDTCLESDVATEHATISFLYMKDFMQKNAPEGMPIELKDHLLFAVLAHARGDYPQHVFTHLTQSADRSQIYGAEGLRRMIACDVGMKGINVYPASAAPGYPNDPQSYGGKADQNLLGHIEYFIRKGNPFPGREELLETTIRLAYLMVKGTEYEERLFQPELAQERGIAVFGSEKALPPQVWQAVTAEPTGAVAQKLEALRVQHAGQDLIALALHFVDAPGAVSMTGAKALPPHTQQSAAMLLAERVDAVPDVIQTNFREALLYALALQDSTPESTLEHAAQHPEPIVRGLSEIVRQAISTR